MAGIIATAYNNIAAVADGALTPQHHIALCRVQLARIRHRAITRKQADATAFRSIACYRGDISAIRYASFTVQNHGSIGSRNTARIRNTDGAFLRNNCHKRTGLDALGRRYFNVVFTA